MPTTIIKVIESKLYVFLIISLLISTVGVFPVGANPSAGNDQWLQVIPGQDSLSAMTVVAKYVGQQSDGSIIADITITNKRGFVYDVTYDKSGIVFKSLPDGVDLFTKDFFPIVGKYTVKISHVIFSPNSTLKMKFSKLGNNGGDTAALGALDLATAATLFAVNLYPLQLSDPNELFKTVKDGILDFLTSLGSVFDLTNFEEKLREHSYWDAFVALIAGISHTSNGIQKFQQFILSYTGISVPTDEVVGFVSFLGQLTHIIPVINLCDDLIISPNTFEVDITNIYGLGIPDAVSLVSPLNGDHVDSLRPTLTWALASRATDYQVELSSTFNFNSLVYDQIININQFQIPADLTSNTDYYWRVFAQNGSGISPVSAIWKFTTPVNNPPNPGHPNDAATFISDTTLPDNTIVTPGQSLTKTWRLQNTGTSTWGSGYKLVFIDGEQMGAPKETDVPTTAPNQQVDMSVPLTAPTAPGDHAGYFQLRNPQGTYFGPQIWVKIKVLSNNVSSGNIISFDISPASPSSATVVHLVGRFKAFTDYRSARFVVGTDAPEQPNIKLIGDQYEISWDWQTASLHSGNYAIAFEVASQGDLDWSHPERQVQTYTLTGTPTSINHPPDRPVLASPYNWFLKDAGGSPASVTLCVNPITDPDGNPVQYWFDVMDQGGGVAYSSSWVSSSCWTNTFNPAIYHWHAKAGDGSASSDWSSDTWNFSVAKGGVYINGITFYNLNTNDTHACVSVTYDGIQGPDVRAWLNEAPDGSDSGTWHQLDGYGPNTTPDCTRSDLYGYWIRSPNYTTGTHLFKVTATKPDSGASVTQTTTYTIAYIAPPSPEILAPSTLTNNGTWWNNRQITFRWNPALRADTYTLRVSTQADAWNDPQPVVNQSIPGNTTSYTATFSQDYAKLYWSVRASNSVGYADPGSGAWFGIDTVRPSCQVQPLPATTYENVFQVSWAGNDNSSGIQSYDIQYQDSTRGSWSDWELNQPASKLYDLFNGEPGHTYYFRCRATDNAGNQSDYPGNPDAQIKVDPQGRPPEAWWNSGYSTKRHLTVLNNMPDVTLPAGYTVHLHFDSSTTPSSTDLYNASLSATKCDDLRITFNNATELDRLVNNCTSSAIDLWFRTQAVVSGGAEDTNSYQLYYGNANPGAPPADRNQVLYPVLDSHYLSVFDMREGSGSVLHDAVGGGDATIDPQLGSAWVATDKFGTAVLIPGDNTPEPRYAIYAGYKPNPTCSFTAEIWLKRTPGNDAPVGFLLSQDNTGDTPSQWDFRIGDNNRLALSIAVTSGSNTTAYSNQSIDSPTFFNNWHHLAVTYTCTTGETKFYIDGILDSTSYLSTALRQVSAPLRIGYSSYNNNRLAGMISGAALSDIVRTDFSYGLFGLITNEPLLAAGGPLTPPSQGNPDLAVQSITSFTNPDGSILVQAVVTNQGTISTTNGFYTDLYVNHVPIGPTDYTGSIQFWVNDPIPAGATVTLTTTLTNLTGNSPQAPLAPLTETTGTIYVQADSTGALTESDKANNISSGVEVCMVTADAYEDDGTPALAKTITPGQSQVRNATGPGDQDWVMFTAQAGEKFTIFTSNLGPSADTYLYIYDSDGTTLLASNDDYGGTLASWIDFTAPSTGAYYILVKQWNPNTGGCGTEYTLTLDYGIRIMLPVVRNH